MRHHVLFAVIGLSSSLLLAACSSDEGPLETELGPAADDAGAPRDEPDEPVLTEPEPDAGSQPEPEPEWSCSPPACSSVDVTTPIHQMRALDACAFEMALEKPISEGAQLADELLQRLESSALGKRVTVAEVLQQLNRKAQTGLTSASLSRLKGLDATGFRWNQGDVDTEMWWSQGITGSSDASSTGLVEGRRLLLTSWYHKTDARPTRGVRLSLVDITNFSDINYRHLLLVDPVETPDGPSFREAAYDGGDALHAGGIVWYGDHLYVADTSKGLRIYDMSRIFEPSKTDDTAAIGIRAGRSDAHGYRYAVPRIARYRVTKASCPIRFSFVGLDRASSPPVLTSGEYFADHQNGKITAWPLDPASHGLETRKGTTRAAEALVIGQTRAQGAVRVGSSYYVSASSQDGTRFGRIYVNEPGDKSRSVQSLRGVEDLYYERDTQRIWTSTEYPGEREVFGMPRSKLP